MQSAAEGNMQNVQPDQQDPNLSMLIAQVKDLPPLPGVVMRAMELALDPDISVRDLHQVISQDQALSAKILKIVNSAMYSLSREVSTVSHAVAVLGIRTVSSVIMAASVEGVFSRAKDLGTKLMSEHSWGAALAARTIARYVRHENLEEALVCGLMHDIGKPVMMMNLKTRYNQIISEIYKGNGTFHESELEAFGFSHAHAGALLARKWNFPPQLGEAVGFHHNPLLAPNHRRLACIINLANLFMISMGIGFEKDEGLDLEKQPSAEFLGLNNAALSVLTENIETAMKETAAIRN
jgi:putative nucleotidyltransferase with HDIG domain